MPSGFADDPAWSRQRYREKLVTQDATGRWWSHSLSGHERNRLFLNPGSPATGARFADASLVSGADDLADARSWCRVDYDRDGFEDIALMSLNAPRFKLLHNNLGNLVPGTPPPVRVRLRGTASNRDAVGAQVAVRFGSGQAVLLHRQCGEGFASQNSAVLSVGRPGGSPVASVEVRWPDGGKSVVDSADWATIVEITEP